MLEKIKTNYLIKVVIGILFIWVVGAIIISFIEGGAFQNIWNSLWWTIVTMTTVGYGDMAPDSALGRILAILIMFCGISLIAVVTGTISSIFTANKIMEGKGLGNITFNNHTLICGWSNNINDIINIELPSSSLFLIWLLTKKIPALGAWIGTIIAIIGTGLIFIY